MNQLNNKSNFFWAILTGWFLIGTYQCIGQECDRRLMSKEFISAKLLQAAEKGNLKMLEELLERNGNIDARGSNGETPLMVAITARQHKCARWLLSKGADPNIQDKNDRSAVSLAAGLEDDHILLQSILRFGGDPNIVQRKSHLHDGSIIHPNTTPIYEAILAGNEKNVASLIGADASLDPEIDDQVASPLEWAIALRQFDIAYMLIKAGADFRTPNPADGLTIGKVLEDFDLSVIGAEEMDERKRKQQIEEQTRWFYRVVKLLQKEGVVIRRDETRIKGDGSH